MKRNQAGRRALGLQVIPPEPKSLGPTVGYLKPVSFDELVARLGPPLVLPEPEEADGRMQVLWRLRWDDGTLNEIYDYKVGPFWLGPREGIHYTKLADWNVSGSPEGYRRLARVFGVPPRREPNPAHRRPNIAAEIIQALLPAIAIGVGLSRRPIPKPELPGLAVHGEAPLGKLRVSFLSQVPWLEFERAANRRRALKRRLMR